MQVMAAAWMMVELTGSDVLAVAVQTAVFLPMFLLALPTGVLADTADRRRLVLAALLTQAASGAMLAALLFAGWAGPGTLMLFIFIASCCTALLSPAYNPTLADAVSRDELPQAITLVGLAYNAAGRWTGTGRPRIRGRRRLELRPLRRRHAAVGAVDPALAARTAPAVAASCRTAMGGMLTPFPAVARISC